MVDIYPQELKWAALSLAFVLIITTIGFGIGGADTGDVPQLNATEVNTDFIPNQTPNLPSMGATEPNYDQNTTGTMGYNDTVLIKSYQTDTGEERELYIDTQGQQGDVDARLRIVNSNGTIIESTQYLGLRTTWGAIDITDPSEGQFTVEVRDRGVEFNDVEYRLADDATDDVVGIISALVNAISGAIGFLADVVVFLVQTVFYIFQFIWGYFVALITGLVLVVSYMLNLMTFIINAFSAIASIHSIIAVMVLLPISLLTFVAVKLLMMVVEILWIG